MRDLCVDPNSECTMEQICRCNKEKGYVPSRDNTSCGKTANYTCNTDSDCADTLSCLKTATTDKVGVCFCRDTESLHENDQKCQIKAGKRCDVTDLKHCVENAVCKHSTCAYMQCVGNLTCLIDPTHTSDVFKLCGCESKLVLSDDKRLCINSATSIHGSVCAILLMFVTAKFLK